MFQTQYFAVFQRKIVHTVGRVAGVGHINRLGLAAGDEFHVIILESAAVRAEGHVESGVTAERERHSRIRVVDDGYLHLHGAADKGITDVIFEIERIHRKRPFVRAHAEIDFVAGEHGRVQRALAHEPVQVHLIGLAFEGIPAFREPAAYGEKVVGSARPERGVALPEILRAVLFGLDGHKFRPDVRYGDFEKIVEYGVIHNPPYRQRTSALRLLRHYTPKTEIVQQ